jgi:SAM-dependent methyltransferase
MAEPLSEAEEYEMFGFPSTTSGDCDFLEKLIGSTFHGKNARLLDLACGTGRHAMELSSRGYSVIGVDISEDMIGFALRRVAERGTSSCSFVAQDIRSLAFDESFDYAYCLFNTLSLFPNNDDFISILKGVRRILCPDGRLIIQMGSVWDYIAKGTFKNGEYENRYDRGSIIRKEKGSFRFAKTNNVYRHTVAIQYTKDGVEYPPRTKVFEQRLFSINELDLLCRLTGFVIEKTYSKMDPITELTEMNVFEENYESSELVFVLKKNNAG